MSKPIPAAIKMEQCGTVHGVVEALSETGGRLRLPMLLETGSLVELAVRVNYSPVRAVAEMLAPVAVKSGHGHRACVQPFRFVALEDEDHRGLCRILTGLRAKSVPEG
jgi:hypothetical protein